MDIPDFISPKYFRREKRIWQPCRLRCESDVIHSKKYDYGGSYHPDPGKKKKENPDPFFS